MRFLRTRTLSFILVWLAALLLFAPSQILRAQSLVVTEAGDAGDGNCDDTCTLRDAVAEANSNPDISPITFNIDPGGAQTIQLVTALTIFEPVTIDGSTQTGWVVTPIITIDGSLASGTDGLVLTGGGSTISNLIIGGFDGTGININTNGDNIIRDNYIGFDGTAPLSNGIGINVLSTNNQIIDNIIANNTGAGVYVAGTAVNNSILNNSIFDNGGLGIDLHPAGVTPNDAGDGDTGPNDYQNFPVITDATPTVVQGMFNSTPNASFRLQFFSTPTCAAPDAEGQTFLDEITITTDGSGNATFSAPLSVSVGEYVTATATGDPLPGSTSEFSACKQVTDAPTYSSSPAQQPDPASALALTTTEGTPATATITVSNPGSTALDITDVVLSNTTDFTLLSSPTFSIASGDDPVDIDIQCNGTTASATPYTTDITVTHNDPFRSPASYTLSCTVNALPVPQFESSPPPPDITWDAPFGGSATFNLTVRNVGDPGSTLTVGGALTDTNNPRIFDIVGGDTFNFGISAGNFRDVQLRCQPSALSTFTATLTLTTDDPDAADQTVTYTLSCTGTQPPGADYVSTPIPGDPINFASTVVGTAVTADLEIRNAGIADLLVSQPAGGYFSGANAADFSFVTGTQPPITLLPNEAWTVRIQCLPSAAGTRTATLTLQTNDPVDSSPSYPLSCPAALLLNPTALPNGTVGILYPDQTITATGGSGAYTFAVTTGALPPGLSLSAGGVLSGTPTQANTYPFTVTATDTSDGTITGTRDYTIVINPPAPVYNSSPAPNGALPDIIATQGDSPAPTTTITVNNNGGTATLNITDVVLTGSPEISLTTATNFAVAPGADAPITLQCDTTNAGSYSTTITVSHDATNIVTPVTYTLNCTVNPPPAPIYTSVPAPAPDSASTISLTTTQGTPVSTSIDVTNTGNAQLDITAITLTDNTNFTVTTPPPINIAPNNGTGTITVQCNATTASGTPFTTNITVIHNAAGSPAVYTFNCTVNAPPAQPRYDSNPPPGALPNLTAVQGDTPAPTRSITIANNGGATLNITGITVTNVPPNPPAITLTTPSSFDVPAGGVDFITVQCSTASSGTFDATISVTHNGSNAPSPAVYTLRCIVSPRSNISLSPNTLPNGTVGTANSQTITASGGTAPYRFAVTSGSLPPGLTLSQVGVLSGMPTTAGTFSFTVTATDNNNATGSRTYSLVIAQPSRPIYTSFPTPGGFVTINTIPNVQANGNISISNTGTAVLRISSVVLSNPANFALLTPPAFDVAVGTSQTATIRCLSPAIGTFLTAVTISHNASGSPASYTIVCNVTTTLLPTATPIGTLPGTLAPTAIPFTPTPAAPGTGAVNNEVKGQALRTGPYLGATLIGSVLTGQQYPILARSRDEGGEFAWYLIQVGNVTGWTSGRFFRFTGNADLLPTAGSIFDQIDNAPDTGMTTMLPALTDMRRRPSGRAAIVRTLPQGAVVSVIGRTRQNGGNYWLHVRYEGQVGWIPAYVENSRGNWENVPIR